MATSGANSWDAVRQTFADQFEQDGTGFIFRQSQKGEAIRVTADERLRFIDGFDQNIRRAKWIMYGGLTLVLGFFVGLSVLRDFDLPQAAIFAGIGIVMIPYFAYYRWAWGAPSRELGSRTPIAGELTADQVRRLRFDRITYGQLGTAALGGLAIPLVGSSHQDVFSGWGRLWLAFGGGVVMLAAVQAFRKWRFEQENSFENVISRSINPHEIEQSQNSDTSASIPYLRYLPLAIILLGFGFIAYTSTGKELAKRPIFFPILMIGLACWSLFTVARGFANGRIGPFVRGFNNTYERGTQPRRYWASLIWNGLLGCFLLVGATFMIVRTDHDRCLDTANDPRDRVSSCSKAIGKGAKDADLADLYASRAAGYFDLKEYRHALSDYSESIRLDPQSFSVRYNRALSYERLGDFRRAIAGYGEAIALRSDDADAYINRGSLFLDTGQFSKALVDFTKAHELKPDDVWPLANRGLAYSWINDRSHAQADFAAARSIDPANPVLLRGEALLSFNAGDMRATVDKINKALDRDPESGFSRRLRAEAYWRLGERDKAKADLRALELMSQAEKNESN